MKQEPYKLNPPPSYDQDYEEAMDTLNSYEYWLRDNPGGNPMSEPTKRPWKAENNGWDKFFIVGRDEGIVARIHYKDGERDRLNAELICTAVNSYEAMKAALEGLMSCIQLKQISKNNVYQGHYYVVEGHIDNAIKEVKAALALAKKETPS